MKTLEELADWQDYRKFLKARIQQVPETGAPIWVSMEPFEFSKWELDVVLIGSKSLALAKELKRDGRRLKEGKCVVLGDVLRVGGFSGGLLKGATRTLQKLALGYTLELGLAHEDGHDGDDDDSDDSNQTSTSSPTPAKGPRDAKAKQTREERKTDKKKESERQGRTATKEAVEAKLGEARRSIDRRVHELIGATDVAKLKHLAAAAGGLFKRGSKKKEAQAAALREATRAEYEEQKKDLVPLVKAAIKAGSAARAEFKELGAEASKQARADAYEDALETLSRMAALLEAEDEAAATYGKRRGTVLPRLAHAIKSGGASEGALRQLAKRVRTLEESEDWVGALAALDEAAALIDRP